MATAMICEFYNTVSSTILCIYSCKYTVFCDSILCITPKGDGKDICRGDIMISSFRDGTNGQRDWKSWPPS